MTRIPRLLRPSVALLVASITLFVAAVPACANPIVSLDFNALAANSSTATIQQHAGLVLTQGGYSGHVTVNGAMANQTYTGDNHVVGPVINGQVRPLTLGTTDNGVLHAGYDTFLMNANGFDRIIFEFSEPIFGIAFDYQIFPNGDVPDGTRQGAVYPDFTLLADGTMIIHTVATMPTDASPLANPELAPQFLGMSGLIEFPNGVRRIEMVDWPVRIGVDNLQFLVSTAVVTPEPTSLFVFAGAACGMLLLALTAWPARRPAFSRTARASAPPS